MMQTGDWIVGLVAMALVLALNWRAVRAQNIPWQARVRMLLIWGAIILGVVLLVKGFQA